MADLCDVRVVRLFDGSLSLRVDDAEVAILPAKRAVSADDLERALRKVAHAIDEAWTEGDGFGGESSEEDWREW